MKKLALMVITDGRWDYLQRTLRSAEQNLKYPWHQKLLVDDSGEETYFSPYGFDFVKNVPRQGLAGAIRTGWDALDDVDYVFHLEDDFVFPAPVDIEAMIEILEYENDVAQIALLRQPWSPQEQQAGGIFHIKPERFRQRAGWVEQRHLFTFNPCVYPASITKNYQADLEAPFTEQLLNDGWSFGYLGGLHDEPRTTHIGLRRSRNYKL